MARKPVLTGGKRDEIIYTAMKLFFENGYEGTSVRMIMSAVGGEIGMFYHYFKSKDELFDRVVGRFFDGFREKFEKVVENCNTAEEIVDVFLPLYTESMAQFSALKGNMHWSIQYALHAKTIAAIVPTVIGLLEKMNLGADIPVDILAGQLVYGISSTIHSKSFEMLGYEDKKNCLLGFMKKVLYVQKLQ